MQVNRSQAFAFTDALLGNRVVGIIGAGEEAETVTEPKAPEAQAILSAVIGNGPYLSDFWLRNACDERPVAKAVEAKKQFSAYLHAVADALEFEER